MKNVANNTIIFTKYIMDFNKDGKDKTEVLTNKITGHVSIIMSFKLEKRIVDDKQAMAKCSADKAQGTT